MTRIQQTEDEVLIFKSFVKVCGLDLDISTLDSPEPPQPDIICYDNNNNGISFELVELLDTRFASRVGKQFSINQLFKSEFDKLESDFKQSLVDKYKSSYIFFSIDDSVSFNKVRNVVPHVFSFLYSIQNMNQKEDYYDLPAELTILERISIASAESFNKGPVFNDVKYGRVGDPTIKLIEQKLNKKYVSEHPVHLLAYIKSSPMFPDEIWGPSLSAFLDDYSQEQPFKHIWVFDTNTQEIKFSKSMDVP